MSPTTPTAGRDAEVAVLQAQQSATNDAMRDLSRSVSEGFAAINTKLDRVSEQSTHIAQMQAEQRSHSEGLTRAFSTLTSLSEKVDRHENKQSSWAAEVEKRLNTGRAVILTIGAVAGLVITISFFFMKPWLDVVQQSQQKLHQMELELQRQILTERKP